ncbi:hypothetical protein N431DRAFT_148656 [Stipitochalara longipes BDJ]|nr:hypothetical protein N431DRAFT_148656 [Stipitochalara longipes BDJ]
MLTMFSLEEPWKRPVLVNTFCRSCKLQATLVKSGGAGTLTFPHLSLIPNIGKLLQVLHSPAPDAPSPSIMSTATRTMTLPSSILQSSKRETIRNAMFKEPCTPPEYKCCFGQQWPPRVRGWSIWDLKPEGVAEKLWNNILFSYTKDLINNIRTDIEVDAALHAWMVGKDETRARPTVVIFSTSEKFRADARRVILRSGFLASYYLTEPCLDIR